MYLDKRDCVNCPEAPSCAGLCKSNEQCTVTVQTCTSCPVAHCVKNESNNAGAIAGGVVGGLAALAIALGLYFWWRFRSGRQSRLNAAYSPDMDLHSLSLSPHNSFRESKVPSITSVGTINTTQARGSNVIPIAYVPGVTVLPNQNQRQSGIRQSIATSNYRASLPDFVMAVHGQPSLVEIGGGSGPDLAGTATSNHKNLAPATTMPVSGTTQLSAQGYIPRGVPYQPGAVAPGYIFNNGSVSASTGSAYNSATPTTGTFNNTPNHSSTYTESLATVGSLNEGGSTSEWGNNSQGAFYSLSDGPGSTRSSQISGMSYPAFTQDTLDASANSGKSMVTIPEDPEETGEFVLDNGPAGRRFGAAPALTDPKFGPTVTTKNGAPGAVPAAATSGNLVVPSAPVESANSGPSGTPPPSTFPRRTSSRASAANRDIGASAASRSSSNGEYMLDLPEEAYLYHGGGHDEERW